MISVIPLRLKRFAAATPIICSAIWFLVDDTTLITPVDRVGKALLILLGMAYGIVFIMLIYSHEDHDPWLKAYVEERPLKAAFGYLSLVFGCGLMGGYLSHQFVEFSKFSFSKTVYHDQCAPVERVDYSRYEIVGPWLVVKPSGYTKSVSIKVSSDLGHRVERLLSQNDAENVCLIVNIETGANDVARVHGTKSIFSGYAKGEEIQFDRISD